MYKSLLAQEGDSVSGDEEERGADGENRSQLLFLTQPPQPTGEPCAGASVDRGQREAGVGPRAQPTDGLLQAD